MSESNLYHAMISDEKSYGFGWTAGQQAERERIIKLIWDNAEVITNQYFYHNALIGEPTAFLIALIKGENK